MTLSGTHQNNFWSAHTKLTTYIYIYISICMRYIHHANVNTKVTRDNVRVQLLCRNIREDSTPRGFGEIDRVSSNVIEDNMDIDMSANCVVSFVGTVRVTAPDTWFSGKVYTHR